MATITTECDHAQGTISSGRTYQENTTVILTATPDNDYRFVQWGDGNTDNPRSVIVEGDATYTSFFDEEQTALDQVSTDGTAVQKILRNEQVLIQRGGKLYTLTGEETNF
ncbi:MAG: hypothetical protein ACI30A_05240 [Paludibacteraceae bacterium]